MERNELVGKANVIVEMEGALHGVAFDGNGHMFIGNKEEKSVYKVAPDGKIEKFVALDDTFTNTEVWNMVAGPDGNLYAAASGRILKISPDGAVQTLLEENFGGNWGACDLKFDGQGNLYVAHDDRVSKYAPNLEKTVFIDGAAEATKIQTAVGLAFDKKYENLYVVDCLGMKVLRCPMNGDGTHGAPQIFDLAPHVPEYVALDENGAAFISAPESNALIKLFPDGRTELLPCENKLAFPQTLSFGKKGFDENSVYVGNKGKTVQVAVGTKA